MRWHLRLGNLPFANIRLMAARKEIPSRLANCRIPKCQSCLYGKATKRPWQTKGHLGTLKEVTLPGQCVSVDQLESPVAGFIGQNKYALRYINEVYNATPALKTGKSPVEDFSQTAIRPKILDFHPPFCPVYVLHNGLQSGGSRPNKWVRRSRVAINLGQSPRHARSVALVLSLLTGYVSAQFHLKHDDFFETVRDVNAMPQSKWQELAQFTPEEMTGKPPLPSAAKD
jgi:hypothetical protein